MAGATAVVRRLEALATYRRADLDRTFPIRIFNWRRQVQFEPSLQPVVAGFNALLDAHHKLPAILNSFDAAYARAMAADKRDIVAVAKMKTERRAWRGVVDAHQKANVAGTTPDFEEFIGWLSRDLDERLAIAESRGARLQRRTSSAKRRAPAAISDDAREAAYRAFADARDTADGDARDALSRLGRYCRKEDPVWDHMAEKMKGFGPNAEARELENAVQGVIGEALALRNPWVLERLAAAAYRARSIAETLGPGWSAVVVEQPVRATTKRARGAAVGELYDSSVWVVRTKPPFEAAPVWVLQVKSGKVSEAARQIASDARRELGPQVWIPRRRHGVAEEHRLLNLRSLLAARGVRAPRPEWNALTTERTLVAPRAPSDTSLRQNLPSWVSVDYIEALMTKRELQLAARAIAAKARP